METALAALFDDLLREADRVKNVFIGLPQYLSRLCYCQPQYPPGEALHVGNRWSGACLVPILQGGLSSESTAWGVCFNPVESQLWGSAGLDYLPNVV